MAFIDSRFLTEELARHLELFAQIDGDCLTTAMAQQALRYARRAGFGSSARRLPRF
jgi:hypothetical protein